MAHFALTVDDRPFHRTRFLQLAQRRLAADSKVPVSRVELGNLALVWAVGPQAPRDMYHGPDGFSLLVGHALGRQGHLAADDLLAGDGKPAAEPDGGYFLSIRRSPGGDLSVEVDLLGLFPVYYAQVGQALLAGSSADFFTAHPDYVAEIDLEGLAGVLLTNGLVTNRSTLRGVRRLDMGHRLSRSAAGRVSEQSACRLRVEPSLPEGEAETIRRDAQQALLDTLRRHQPASASAALLLSGGIDSRLLAGCLRHLQIPFTAVTMGLPTDFEVRAASRVAAALDAPFHPAPAEMTVDQHAETARRVARLEHLSAGFGSLDARLSSEATRQVSPVFWSGILLDDVMGGYAIRYASKDGTATYETFFERVNRWGVTLEQANDLLRGRPGLVEDCLERYRQWWQGLPGDVNQRSFQAKLAGRGRCHLGGAVHRMSFTGWPLLPVLDRPFLERMLQVPPSLTEHRSLQTTMLCQQFPRLSAIPLDSNSFRFESLDVIRRAQRSPLHKLWIDTRTSIRKRYWMLWRRVEPRRYARKYDINGPHWRRIREMAEEGRSGLAEYFHPRALQRHMPLPHAHVDVPPFGHGSNTVRLLAGTTLWLDQQCQMVRRAA